MPHHRAHAASAFYASGLESAAAVLVNDGNGEDESISIYEARFGAPVVRGRCGLARTRSGSCTTPRAERSA